MQTQERYYSPEEYLELETAADYKSEYYDGQIFPRAGGSPNHNQVAGNFYAGLNFALKGQNYDVFIGDMRLWIPRRRLYTYPDVMVVAGPLAFAEGRRDTITNPLIITEVLSESTKNYDHGEKFEFYRTIPSFQEYILIDQYKIYVEQFSKLSDNQWMLTEFDNKAVVLTLTAVPFQISLQDLYDKVDFAEE